MIEAKELGKDYGSLPAVKGLNLTVLPGELFGFLGPNGAGKSTTIRMLAGLLKPSRGTAIVAGFDVLKEPLEVKRRIGYMAESPYLYTKLTGREFLSFMGDLYGVKPAVASERADRLLALFELADKADELVEGYSHGMRQKLALAGTLLHEPQLLFLDEPTSGLDPRSARVVKDLAGGAGRKGPHGLPVHPHPGDRPAHVPSGGDRRSGRVGGRGLPGGAETRGSGRAGLPGGAVPPAHWRGRGAGSRHLPGGELRCFGCCCSIGCGCGGTRLSEGRADSDASSPWPSPWPWVWPSSAWCTRAASASSPYWPGSIQRW